VTDGFTGNIFVKTAETTARLMNQVITEEVKKSPLAMFGALLARNSLRRVRERMDDSHYGGAVLLGLSSVVIVAHGRSNAFRHPPRHPRGQTGGGAGLMTKIQRGIAAIEHDQSCIRSGRSSFIAFRSPMK
jgi:glycerol-3-phosphate acyltransferase PlsX